MIHASLFSGIGGFDLAAEWMGWENAFHCEWNPFGQKVLKYYWPNATSYEDITKTDFSIWRGRIDILTGGFPCQPYSVAGERKGKDDERHLWPEMLRAIREIQPSWVVGENVRGIINWNAGMVFDEVQANLEAEGYKIIPFLLPASGVGKRHERYRTWYAAYSECAGLQRLNTERKNLRLHSGQTHTEFSNGNVFEGDNRSQSDGKHIRTGNGIPNKLHKQSITALGNAIVPQVAFQIFKAVGKYVQLTSEA